MAESQKFNKVEDFKAIRPTLYIGIGGTGKEIILRLRRRILQTLWNGKRIDSLDSFPVTSFYYIDTYTGKALVDDKNRETDNDENNDEGLGKDPLIPLIELSPESDCLQKEKKADFEKYFTSEIERYPHIKEWLPEGELKEIDPSEGAGQVRAISRLLFFDEFNNIKETIRDKISRLVIDVRDEENDLLKYYGLEINQNKEINVVVLCSLAGGTGSGGAHV